MGHIAFHHVTSVCVSVTFLTGVITWIPFNGKLLKSGMLLTQA